MAELIKTKSNGQWSLDEAVEKKELNLDKEIVQSKTNTVPTTPDYPLSPTEAKAAARADKAKQPVPKSAITEAKFHINKSLEEKVEDLAKSLWELKKQHDYGVHGANMHTSDIAAAKDTKNKVGVIGYGSNVKFSSSPGASGVPHNYNMGRTKSGKKIGSMEPKEGSLPYYHDYSSEDHRDAYFAHGQQAKELKANPQVHPDLPKHHEAMAASHWEKFIASKEPKKPE